MNKSLNLTTFLLIFTTFNCLVVSIYIPPGPRYRCPEKAQSIHPCHCIKESDVGINVRCENTNLASLSIGLNNLASHGAPVEELILHKCHISHLYGNLFFKVQVRVLTIQETPITQINEYTFYGINETLNEFHLINSKLNQFPKDAFKVLGNLTKLVIDGHEMETLEKDIFVGSTISGKLERFHFINGNLTDLPIESFQPLRKLKYLDVHGNKLTVLKRNQFKDLRDIEVLDLSHNNIGKLDSSHISDLTKMGWCNVSHNALTELTRGAFARNSLLKWLSMSNNKIKRLDSNSFRGMRFLRRLYVSDNAITDVARGTFGSITRIGTIDLARNQLKKVDFQMFSQLNYVEIIDVAENNITEISKQSFKDLYLTKINISYNALSKIEPGAFENCANMTLLDLSHNQLKSIPKTAFDSTTYALELQITYNQLTDLSDVPLTNMTGLKILNASYNEINTIPKNTFPKLYELHTIDLSHNNISDIFNAVFTPLFSLRSLNLSYNSLEIIKPPTFGTLPTLLELDMSNNKLRDIAKGALTKLASCRELTLENNYLENIFTIPISLNHFNLRNNWIMEIPERTWPVMNAMLTLDLSGNRLGDNLKGGSFAGLLTLQRLLLSSNGLTKVPWESLIGMTTLQYLYLENNNLTELSKGAFGKLPVVFELNLYNNQISTVSQKAFDGLLQLLNLNLSSNSLRHIPNEAFYGLVSLRELDLSRNSLEKFDNKTHGLLDDCLSLQKINLSHNRISFVTRKTFPSNPYIPYRLREIDLSYNLMPVLTYDIIFGTKNVIYLNVSHNSISDLRRGILGNMTSLETLDLSYNDLKDLTNEQHIFDLPANITNIYLNNNNLEKIPIDKIEKAKNLKLLDLRDNFFDRMDRVIIEKIKQGATVLFEGNPLKCECSIRPLKHYLQTLTDPPELYTTLQCDKPSFIKGRTITDVQDDYLSCQKHGNDTEMLSGEEYDILPDLRFRQIMFKQGTLFAQWYVTSNRDNADFYVNLRDDKNNIKLERHLSYETRSIEIPDADIPNEKFIQLCVLAKGSNGNLNGWFESQCQNLPENFKMIRAQYNAQYKKAYTILTTDKKRVSKLRNSKTNGVKKNEVINILVLLAACTSISLPHCFNF